MRGQFKIEGARELDKVLSELPLQLRRRVVANATRAGGRVLAKEMKRQAPYDPKRRRGVHLRDSIVVRKKRGTNDIILVGPSNHAYHAHLVEFGTGHRTFGKARMSKGVRVEKRDRAIRVNLNGRWVTLTHSGRMPANPFMRRSLAIAGRAAIDKIGENLARGIERVAVRLAGRYGTSGLATSRFRKKLTK